MTPMPALIALLNGIIPPRPATGTSPGLDGAGDLGLAPAVLADAAASQRQADLAQILTRLPADIADLDPHAREVVLRALAEELPRPFASVINMAYTAYYTDPRVLHALQRRTGYQATPPQPGGYDLAAFDPALLERVRTRPPLWRRA
jgi:hypothetical protein